MCLYAFLDFCFCLKKLRVSHHRGQTGLSTWDCRCGQQGPAGDCLCSSLLISLTDNLLLTDELITNGFHSCESDDDDRTSHASSSDWTPRPRIGMLQACASLKQSSSLLSSLPRSLPPSLIFETRYVMAQASLVLCRLCPSLWSLSHPRLFFPFFSS